MLDGGGFDFGAYRFHSTIVKELDFNWKTFVDGFQEVFIASFDFVLILF